MPPHIVLGNMTIHTLLSPVLLLFIFAGTACAQDAGEETITWSPARKLTWSDYKGTPNPSSDAAASTATYLGLTYNIRNNQFTYEITCLFSQTKSWGRHKNDHILAHEQGHFDIAEIHARKLYKAMKQYAYNEKTFRQKVGKIYQDITREKEIMQAQYDQETNHSINKEQQAVWQEKIAKLLEEYADHAGYRQP